ncbi:MAG: hypothetical protein IJQ03_04300, partial [Firmicutes bacterium]|nr:hypothetical protein [Bacillota bacterium]
NSLYQNIGDEDGAKSALDKARSSYQSVADDKKLSDAEKASAYAGLGRVCLTQDDAKKAKEYIDKALEADGKNVDAICTYASYLVSTTGSYYQGATYLSSQLSQFDESSEEYNTIYSQFYNYYIYYAIYGM